MTKLNRNNRNETKSDIFSWKTFKYDLIFSLLKNINDCQNPPFFCFMTMVNPNNGNETKSDIFPWDIFKFEVTHIFIRKY